MLTAKLHVQIAFMVERLEWNRLVVGKSDAFEEIEDGSDRKHVVDVDEGDEA